MPLFSALSGSNTSSIHYHHHPCLFWSTSDCSIAPLLHCSITPLLHYSTAPLLHCSTYLTPYPNQKQGETKRLACPLNPKHIFLSSPPQNANADKHAMPLLFPLMVVPTSTPLPIRRPTLPVLNRVSDPSSPPIVPPLRLPSLLLKLPARAASPIDPSHLCLSIARKACLLRSQTPCLLA
ncbi:hypothetical protein K504DRAFT_49078 [Pleomassaria siparia CBS 279.74]|uniref:Uncharacterized protein n=1 Tax=Pleomassaria siparia CBS 279.74 TaxID=1314801 RepID=A0A6G1K355_9PLEO|nr:hypothetical protein K504DRAFT_49078 [Pleomassaria siparia CBS 279.74]